MQRGLIVALLALLLGSEGALAQGQGGARGREPRPQRIERPQAQDRQPDDLRRSRIDRAERSIRERRSRQGGASAAPRDGDGMIYRRSNTYRRW